MNADDLPHHELPLLFEKRLPHSTEEAAYCDVHDLIAIVHEPTQDVVIYRLNGQVAFSIKRIDPEHDVTAVKWKPDGSLLGVGWTDGACSVYSGETGKLLSQTSIVEKEAEEDWKLDLTPDSGVRESAYFEESVHPCFGWTSYASTNPSKTTGPVHETTEDWFDGFDDDIDDTNQPEVARSNTGISKLVESITTLDVTKVLPRLSAIPTHGAKHGVDGGKFSTQASIDSMFEAKHATPGLVDTFVTCGTSGYGNVHLNESVKVGSFDIQRRALMHASHPRCQSQVILSDTHIDGKFRLHYLDLPLDTLGGPLLQVIALNTKRLQDITEYIKQTVRCIQHDFATGLQLPSALIQNMTEELSQKEEGSLATNLYELAMTGHFTPTMLEWFTDIIGENKHKRWDQAVNTMYANVQNHVFFNLLPALDRLSIAANVLRGHARLHEDTGKFDVASEVFESMLDHIDSVRLVAQKIQLIVMSEHRQFRAFSKWMRIMIEVGVAGPGTKGAAETEEREIPNLDYGLLLAYIGNTLTHSQLVPFVEQRSDLQGKCSQEDFFAHPVIAHIVRARVMAALERLNSTTDAGEMSPVGKTKEVTHLLNLPALTVRLAAQTRVTVDDITRWQSKMLSYLTVLPLITPLAVEADATILDMRMFPLDDESVESVTELLITSPANRPSNELSLYRINRLAPSMKYDQAQADFNIVGGEILHAKMLNAKDCLVLSSSEGETVLVNCDLEAHGLGQAFVTVLLKFTASSGFTPGTFILGGRKHKMVCVLFGDQGRVWRVYDLNHGGATERTGPADLFTEDDDDMRL